MTLGRERGWNTSIVGKAPMPEASLRVGEWLIVPVQEDSSRIPARALRRVQAIYEAGIKPRGFVIVHEAPMRLAPPDADVRREAPPLTISPSLLEGVKVVGRVLGTIVGGVAVASIAAVFGLPIVLLMGVALLDPILIAVTEDGYWIEIDRWWNEEGGKPCR